VAGHGPVGGLGGTFADHDHVLDAAGVRTTAPGAALGPPGAQATGQLPAQLTAALHEQGLVDGLVAHPHHGIACELDPQPGRDLLRRPPGLQPPADLGSQPRARQLRNLGAARSLAGTLMGPPRPVPAAAAVASHVPRHRRGGLAQPRRDHGKRLTGVQAEADLLPVAQPQPARPRHPGIDPALRAGRAATRDDPDQHVRAADLAPDLPQRQATGLQPQRQLPLLHRQMSHHAHSPRPNQRIVVDSPRLRAPVERAPSTIS
jgi:hypothetical protein